MAPSVHAPPRLALLDASSLNDKAIGASLCAKGAAGIAFEYDDQRRQTPLIRSGPRGAGQWRRASRDEALDSIADKLKDSVETFGARGSALSDRSAFNDLARTFVKALGSPNYFNDDATCGGNVHNAARSIFGFSHAGLVPDRRDPHRRQRRGRRTIITRTMVCEQPLLAYSEPVTPTQKPVHR